VFLKGNDMTGLFNDSGSMEKLLKLSEIAAGEDVQVKRRKPGRPARGKQVFVRISVNVDPDLHAMLETLADYDQIPASRVLNKILRVFYELTYKEHANDIKAEMKK
jgi:hypothetical protein